MKNFLNILLISLSFANNLVVNFNYDQSYSSSFENDIRSNSIYEIVELNDTLWLRTGAGISFMKLDNQSMKFETIINSNLPEGGSPAFVINDSSLFVSGSKSIYDGRYRPKGTGLSWSINNGVNWNYINQPLDENPSSGVYTYETWGNQDSVAFKAITTEIYNISYDLDVYGNYLYATSFAGGLRRFNYNVENPEWELVPLPMDDQFTLNCNEIDLSIFEYDPVNPPEGNDNHKAFSVHIIENIIWVGTGDGINKGIIDVNNNCIDWIHYNEDDGLSDRWVVGITDQMINNQKRLWAITWDPSLNSAIPHTLNYTDDEGESWNTINFFKDIGAIVYDLNFDNENIFASTSLGLYKNYNGNLNLWDKYDIIDSNGQIIFSDAIYSSFKNEILIIAGSTDGIFASFDDGLTWQLYRSWNQSNPYYNDDNILSAYPNPFYVDEINQFNNDGHIRITYLNGNVNDNAKIDIFDFSMNHIIHLNDATIVNNQGQFIWNGRNKFNNQVTNGVYFCRLNLLGKIHWTKIMVINS